MIENKDVRIMELDRKVAGKINCSTPEEIEEFEREFNIAEEFRDGSILGHEDLLKTTTFGRSLRPLSQ